MSLIQIGTLGSNDWVYEGCNPWIEMHNRSGDIAFEWVDENYTNKTQRELRDLFVNAFNYRYKYNKKTYKTAIYKVAQSATTWEIGVYQNKNGIITKANFTQVISEHGLISNYKATYNTFFGDVKTIYINENAFADFDGNNAYFEDTVQGGPEYQRMVNYLLNGSGSIVESDNTNIKGAYDGILADGLMNCFLINNTNMLNLAALVSAGGFAGNLGEAILSIKLFNTPGGNIVANETSQIVRKLDITVNGRKIVNQGQHYEIGSFKFNEKFNNFLDYSPFTSIKLFLPYSGMVELDSSIVMGGTLKLSCTIDMISGNIIWFGVVENKDVTGATSNSIYNWIGNVSCDAPITVDDFGRKISSFISATAGAVSGTASISSGRPIQGVSEITNAAMIIANSSSYITAGNLTSNNGMGSVQYPYLIITRPKISLPSNYNSLYGRPSMKYSNFSDLNGYTEVDSMHLENMGLATQEEIDEIETLLKDGVIF